ncbi:SGNH/GDSL hydrolase family protein [Streptomyces somaliensis DSM 40738]|uniref:SGNH/GDSL hydrolase family protein n=1 Tax=Streptomyces somaliensis (strain ATCC 33201 / DSM 40738 / JCM 12659 / KCTC 9044 / NCTC 11332 / NRRL B-12077 / IP 733) TaxID=1134445 RepID=A0AA44DCU8_STRE0|nr:SGNH/GDSL hydrolase family protein [Streptomyces somaliensis]MCQ0025008.1 SGNH/GDSL hydrolase family protein [Streptomyces somaliensis DSM 40738]NKY14045.1 SGNH/GDSL hydrolase family protein [Streptomyces somaliensis DSM 40738]
MPGTPTGRPRRTALATAVAAAACTALLTPVAPASAAELDRYVGMGDSYSSGNGAFSTNLNSACGRNTYAYPYLVARSRPNTSLDFVACQGATTEDVPGQARALSADTDYVSITIGGNDVGFANLIVNCAGSWSPTCDSAIDNANNRIRNELPAKLDKAYATIRAGAPNATVVVLGYGRVFGQDLSCPAAAGASPDKAAKLNAVADNLDAVTRNRAEAAGFVYKSSIRSFTGHDVCAADPWINGATWSVGDSYHPTRSGYANGFAPAVRAVIG